MLLLGPQVADAHQGFATGGGGFPFDGVGGFHFLGALELFVGLGGDQGIFHGQTRLAEMLHELQTGGPQGFVFDQTVGVDGGVKGREQAADFEQFEEHDIPETETQRGEVHLAAADEFYQVVVAPAAGDGAELALFVERFKHHASVIGEAANDLIIHFDVIPQAARGEVVEDAPEFHGRFARLDEGGDFVEIETQLGELFAAHGGIFALEFVDDLVKGVGFAGVRAALIEIILPGVAAAQADDKIIGGQPKGTQHVDEQGDQLGVGRRVRLAENVGVELEVLAQTPLLLPLIAEQLGDGEPLDGLFVVALMRGDHARQGGRHFRAQRDFAAAFVGEIVQLPDDFVAAFEGVELQRLQRGAVVFAEAVAARHGAPFSKNVLAGIRAPHIGERQRLGIKVPESRQTIHHVREAKRKPAPAGNAKAGRVAAAPHSCRLPSARAPSPPTPAELRTPGRQPQGRRRQRDHSALPRRAGQPTVPLSQV